MSSSEPNVSTFSIDYAGPVLKPPMSARFATWTALMSTVPVAVGLSLLTMFRVTADDRIVDAGMIWLLTGSLWAAAVGFVSLGNLSRSLSRRPVQRWVVRANLFALIQVGVAPFAAFYFGSMASEWYLAPHVSLSAMNATGCPIDNLVIHFDSGDIAAGPLQPGQTRDLGTRWVSVKNALEISVTVNGQTLRKTDRPTTDLWYEKQPFKRQPVKIIVEEAELPRLARSAAARQAPL